jgi:hypothetical protein
LRLYSELLELPILVVHAILEHGSRNSRRSNDFALFFLLLLPETVAISKSRLMSKKLFIEITYVQSCFEATNILSANRGLIAAHYSNARPGLISNGLSLSLSLSLSLFFAPVIAAATCRRRKVQLFATNGKRVFQ